MLRDLSKAIGYFRLSTQKQLDEYHSFDAYMDRFIKFGFKSEQIYYDIASGGDNTREKYLEILQMIQAGAIEDVYIPEISRFSRSVEGFEQAMKYFQITGANLISLDGHEFKLTTPMDRTNVRMLILMATQEREINQYRALKGHEFLREEGRAVRPVFPYVKPNDKLLPNTSKYKDTEKTTWEVGRELVETFLKEQNLSKTIKIMTLKYGDKSGNFWEDFPRDHSGFRDWLKCQSIRGNLEYFGGRRYKRKKNAPEPILLYNTHKPLITEEEYHQIELIFKIGNQTRTKASKLRNLWVGKLFCECGSPMKISGSKSGKNYFWYVVCKSAYPNSSNVKARQALGLETACKHRSSYGLTLKKLEDLVIDGLCKRAEEIAKAQFPDAEKHSLPPEVIELNNSHYATQNVVRKEYRKG